jgi:hypothetical protein
MTDQEELNQFREEKKGRLKRARRTALVFGVLAITALIAFVYAFFQQTAANRAKVEAEIQAHLAFEASRTAEEKTAKFEEIARRATQTADSLKEACQQKSTKLK